MQSKELSTSLFRNKKNVPNVETYLNNFNLDMAGDELDSCLLKSPKGMDAFLGGFGEQPGSHEEEKRLLGRYGCRDEKKGTCILTNRRRKPAA